MKIGEVRLWKLTRRMVREAMATGHFKGAIVPTGSTEQHNEYLAMEHDTASALHIARHAAVDLYPHVLVTPPVPVGISEHWMEFPGSLTLKPETFTAVVYDICESLSRHGVEHILIVNGHAGNGRLRDQMDDFRQKSGIDIEFCCYWDAFSKERMDSIVASGRGVGHAAEFEASFAYAAFPENVHWDQVDYEKANLKIKSESYAKEDPAAYIETIGLATAHKGRIIIDEATAWVTEKIGGMMGLT